MEQGDFKKYQEVSEAFKEIINTVTTQDLGQVKLFFVNLEKKIQQKEPAIYGQYTSLKEMLDSFKQAKGKVALHFAIARGDLQIIKHMIENLKLDAYVKDNEGNNPFFTAIEHGHLQIVQYFVEQLNFSVNMTKQGQISCLHLASNHNNPEVLKYLITKGADVQKVSIYGKPINWAAGSANTSALKILLDNKANPNGDSTCPAPAPLILAIDFGNRQMYNLLLHNGADVHIRDPHGYSTLHVAAEKGDIETVKDLIERGVQVEYEVQGKTALYLAFENHKFQVVKFLKEKSKNYEAVEQKIKKIREEQAKYEENKPKAEDIKQVGNKFYSEKKYNEALVEYKKALQYDRDNIVIHRNMAACYLALQKYEDALHSCQLAKAGDPKNVKTLYREAQAYVGLGNLIEASASFWQCSMLQPQTPLFRVQFQKYVDIAKKAHGK